MCEYVVSVTNITAVLITEVPAATVTEYTVPKIIGCKVSDESTDVGLHGENLQDLKNIQNRIAIIRMF
jgi:hypothetical protein